MLNEAGFDGAELVCETGFNSSPVTRGALIRAVKPAITATKEGEKAMAGSLDTYQAFFDEAYQEGALDRKTKHLIALGASLGSGCDP